MIEWKYINYSADPNIAFNEIQSIGDSVTPEQIVEYAENNPNSELHKCFTWDDTEAARKWRLHEARQIVCNIVYKPEVFDERPPIKVRAILHTEEGYKPTQLIVKNVDEYQSLLSRAFADLIAFKERYKTLTELEEIFEEIDKLI